MKASSARMPKFSIILSLDLRTIDNICTVYHFSSNTSSDCVVSVKLRSPKVCSTSKKHDQSHSSENTFGSVARKRYDSRVASSNKLIPCYRYQEYSTQSAFPDPIWCIKALMKKKILVAIIVCKYKPFLMQA